EAASAVVLPFRQRDDAPPLPADEVLTRRPDGEPETGADTRFFDYREAGYTGLLDQDGNIPDPSDPQNARALDLLAALRSQQEKGSKEAAPAPSTEGSPTVAAEMTYTEPVKVWDEIVDECERVVESVKRDRLSNLLDSLTSMGLRGRTLSDFAAVDDHL